MPGNVCRVPVEGGAGLQGGGEQPVGHQRHQDKAGDGNVNQSIYKVIVMIYVQIFLTNPLTLLMF